MVKFLLSLKLITWTCVCFIFSKWKFGFLEKIILSLNLQFFFNIEMLQFIFFKSVICNYYSERKCYFEELKIHNREVLFVSKWGEGVKEVYMNVRHTSFSLFFVIFITIIKYILCISTMYNNALSLILFTISLIFVF